MTPRLTLVSLISLIAIAFGCASTGAAPNQSLDLESAHVVVAPMNLGIARSPQLDSKSGMVGRELIGFLQDEGAEVSVLTHEDGLDLWGEAFEASGESSRDFAGTASEFARGLADEGEFDLVILPSVVVRKASVHGSAAHWDGVVRQVETNHPVVGRSESFGVGEFRIKGLDGQMAAASLHIVVMRANGEQVFEGISGLELIQRAELHGSQDSGEWKLAEREEPLRDLDSLREGIEMAFDQRLKRTARSW